VSLLFGVEAGATVSVRKIGHKDHECEKIKAEREKIEKRREDPNLHTLCRIQTRVCCERVDGA